MSSAQDPNDGDPPGAASIGSPPETNDADPLGLDPEEKLGRLAFAGIALGSFVALMVLVSWLRAGRIDSGTGAVGLGTLIAAPLLLGIVAGLRRPRRPALTAWQLVLLCMVVSAPVLGEGLMCMILILPWNLVLAPIVALLTAWISRSLGGHGRALLLLVPMSALLPLLDARRSTEELPPVELVDSVLVEAPIEQVWSSLEYLRLPLDTPAPLLVRLGLPQPVGIEGGGAFVGAERRTRVTHRTRYRPLISPRWYFEPVEVAGGRLVQRYLLEAYAHELQRFGDAGPAVSSR